MGKDTGDATVRYRAAATFLIRPNAVPLDYAEMDRRIETLNRAIRPEGRARGEPDLIAVIIVVSADSGEDAERIAAERLEAALVAADLSASFRTRRLDVTRLPG